MKKSAFTLVELLAVIVILGIIGLITLPIISKNIETSRIDMYRSNVQTVLEASKEYVSKNTKNHDYPMGGLDIKKIDVKNNSFKSGTINRCPIKNYEGSECAKNNIEPGEIYVQNVYDGRYCANGTKQNIIVQKVKNKEECETIDSTGPELTLKLVKTTKDSMLINAYGYDSQTEILKYTFQIGNSEPKEIYTDKSIAAYEFTNLDALKKYNITVSVSNINALSEDEQYKKHPETHTTVDSESLTEIELNQVGIPQFKISGNNYANTKELTIIYPEIEGGINGYIIEDFDGEIKEEKDNVEQEIKLNITENVRVVAYTNYGEDKVENAINIVGIDDKGPDIEVIPMDDTWEQKKLLTVVVNDVGVGLSKRTCSFDGGKTWIATKKRTVNGEKKTVCEKLFSKNQIVDFRARDKMGNESPSEGERTTNPNSPYYIEVTRADSEPPTCKTIYESPVGYSGQWINKNVIVRGLCDDKGLSGCEGDIGFTYTTERNGNFYPSTDGVVRDAVGNETVCKPVSVKIDRTAPSCGGAYGGKSYWTQNQNVTIGAYCNDPFGECTSSLYTSTISGEGRTQNATFTIRDKAGNTRNCTYTYNKYIDMTAPWCAGQFGGKTNWTQNTGVYVGAYCGDGLSGCQSGSYATYISGEGVGQYATVRIYDAVGNARDCTYYYNKYIDMTPPWCAGKYDNTNWTNQYANVGVYCGDSLSGCQQGSFGTTLYNEGITEWVGITIRDNVGHETYCPYEFNKYIDKTPPFCTKYTSGIGSSYATGTITMYDNLSGFDPYNGYSFSYSVSDGGGAEMSVDGTDHANNYNSCNLYIYSSPSYSSSSGGGVWYAGYIPTGNYIFGNETEWYRCGYLDPKCYGSF